MNRGWFRLLLAGGVALGVHGVVLFWAFPKGEMVLPSPLSTEQITVSLGFQPQPKPVVEPKEVAPKSLKPVPAKPLPVKPHPASTALLPEPQPVLQLVPDVTEAVDDLPEQQPAPQVSSKEQLADVLDPAREAGSLESSRVIQQATPLYRINPPPKYPALARRRGVTGVVILEVFVDISGRVQDLKISHSSNSSLLDKAALRAVRRWQFRAGSVGGNPHSMWVRVPVRFQLQ